MAVNHPASGPAANYRGRQAKGQIFSVFGIFSIGIALGILLILFGRTFFEGVTRLDTQFISSVDSTNADEAGILGALVGSLWLMFFVVLFSLPIGVSTAIYLEEYARDNWFTRFIQVNISNQAGVPSIVFGLLGLQIFARFLGLGPSLLAGALTMTLLILPIVIVASREAIRAVPQSLRQASYAVGATKWQTTRKIVLPQAFAGILTGNILSASRALGEAAPLITVGAFTFVPFLPRDPLDKYTVLPIQIFTWIRDSKPEFQSVTSAGIIVLLAILLLMNSVAIYLRQRLRKRR